MWYIISLIIVFIILILIIKNKSIDFDDKILTIFVVFVLWMVTTVLLLSFSSITANKVIKTYEEKQYDIQGLENNIITNKDTKGAFVLGFGYINSTDKENIKYYYFKVDELGKKLETLEITNYSNIYIRETDDKTPCLVYVYEEIENNNFFKLLLGVQSYTNKIAEVLIVPKNTIKIEYNVKI